MTLLFKLLMILVTALNNSAASEESSTMIYDDDDDEESIHVEPAYAVLFPPFTLTLGVIIFYILSRYAKSLPYTAIMFLLGTIMGIVAASVDHQNHVTNTIRLWQQIDSEVLLLVFLPGLLFKDAMSQNVHLFIFSIFQLLIFAFPMVLAGTYLTALVGQYVFPYGWSFNLSMAFGAILSATDPVAVAALLEEVGAPPRLKTHVAGESLLNDGAAIVFFKIFETLYLFEKFGDDKNATGVEEEPYDQFGGQNFTDDHHRSLSSEIEDIDLKAGFTLFFRMSLGGMAIGFAFGLGQLLLLLILNRRISREENIVQVTSVTAVAYLNFYVAEFVCHTSGVISTVTAGLFVKLFGRAAINDIKLMHDFGSLVEHFLNTILFTLGGIIWGEVVANGEVSGIWTGRDWGYLFILYLLLLVIRGVLFAIAYPIISRIGLKSNWRETFFQIYGGLRGALGIALAIALDNQFQSYFPGEVVCGTTGLEAECHTTQAFTMIGGIAFFTLVINGITAGPLLKKLGLADSTEAREKIISAYKIRLRAETIDDLVILLSQPRFHQVNFALIKHHVPWLKDLTRAQFMEAVNKYKDHAGSEYVPPFLRNVLPYLPEERDSTNQTIDEGEPLSDEAILAEYDNFVRKVRMEARQKYRKRGRTRRHSSNIREMMKSEPLSAKELRILFVSILRAQYDKQVRHGELENERLLTVAIDESLEFAAASIGRDKPLKDWEWLTRLHDPLAKFERRITRRQAKLRHMSDYDESILKLHTEATLIERSMAFLSAHEAARAIFQLECEDFSSELSVAGQLVIHESLVQCRQATEALSGIDPKIIALATSHKVCKILLNQAMYHVEKLVRAGLLKESEAEDYIEELEEDHDHVLSCNLTSHPGEYEIVVAEQPEESVLAIKSKESIGILEENPDDPQEKALGGRMSRMPSLRTSICMEY